TRTARRDSNTPKIPTTGDNPSRLEGHSCRLTQQYWAVHHRHTKPEMGQCLPTARQLHSRASYRGAIDAFLASFGHALTPADYIGLPHLQAESLKAAEMPTSELEAKELQQCARLPIH